MCARRQHHAEVENAIARHPGITRCAAIGLPHEGSGESVHAIVVTQASVVLSKDPVQAHFHSLIAVCKCLNTVEFRTEMPLSTTGTVLK